MKRRGMAVGLGLFIVVVVVGVSCIENVRRGLISALTPEYEAEGASGGLKASFEGLDLDRERMNIALEVVADGFKSPVDIQFPPGSPETMVVLEQRGVATWVSLADGARGRLLEVDVLTDGEQGLLGLAFHPRFEENGRFFINQIVSTEGGRGVSRIDEWACQAGEHLSEAKARFTRTVLTVPQPYQNHNAGQLAFGPDAMLYIGMGDGGFADDPHGHGQNTSTLLGSMLRLDVDGSSEGRPYAIPGDNPFAEGGGRAEIWAWGLRNPWRYSFAPDGRLLVGDVGQDSLEEVTLVGRGENHGWKTREGNTCFEPSQGCQTDGLVEPAWTYGRRDGVSITGGYVYEGSRLADLKGMYVFGDFVTGRLWAIEVPAVAGARTPRVLALGRWPLLVSTFGRGADGEIYLASYNQGKILRLAPP